eukprot:g3484.t1
MTRTPAPRPRPPLVPRKEIGYLRLASPRPTVAPTKNKKRRTSPTSRKKPLAWDLEQKKYLKQVVHEHEGSEHCWSLVWNSFRQKFPKVPRTKQALKRQWTAMKKMETNTP